MGCAPSHTIGPQGLTGKLSHQIQLGWPDIPVGGCMVNQRSVDHHPVMGRCDLADEVIGRLDADMVGFAHEDATRFSYRDAPELGHDDFDDEPAARSNAQSPQQAREPARHRRGRPAAQPSGQALWARTSRPRSCRIRPLRSCPTRRIPSGQPGPSARDEARPFLASR